ncbi:MAG: arylamine N-acetyltransferase [Oligoflexia bacterium]|nr:arylamine N-acetyltransferase [Oligoflexia bacterium]
MSEFPIDEYLAKIKATKPKINEQSLFDLHRANCFSIAFENINPLLQKPVYLDLESLTKKILKDNRGGYCFELNEFFYRALEVFGFECKRALGRVFMGRAEGGPRTHQVTIVTFNNRSWLADVGFGGPGLIEPIPLEDGYETVQHNRKIRIRKHSDWGYLYEDEFEGSWRIIYAVPLEKSVALDFTLGNYFCSSHPDAIFTNSLFCALPTLEGKVTVWNRSLHIFTGKEKTEKTEKTLDSLESFQFLFKDLLKLTVSEKDIDGIHKKILL